MRIAIIGQQAFGASVLEAFLKRGDEIAGVFCAPEKAGAKPDPLRLAAEKEGLKVFQFPSLKGEPAKQALKELDVELGVMAYVLQFAPQDFVNIPRHGMIQYHPSLLPLYRGPSSINWPIIKGDSKTGLTIFRPNDGLDEGPVILQKTVAIGPDDTLGSVYFNHLFPLGVEAMLEAADLVVAGKHQEIVQDEEQASYEGWCKDKEAQINWHAHIDHIYNLIRGCDPAPGAWTTIGGIKLRIYETRKHPVRRFEDVREYREFTKQWLSLAVANLVPNAPLVIWTNLLGREPITTVAKSLGYAHQLGEFVWGKRTRQSNSGEEILRVVETALVFSTSAPIALPPDAPAIPWSAVAGYDDDGEAQRWGNHPNHKPFGVIEPLIRTWSKPGQLVVDAFGGSGSIPSAAVKLGREAACLELEPEWAKRIQERLS